MQKNYYQILGLEEGASEEEIRKAFRLYAQKFHPDKHNGDEFFKQRFEEIKEAHDELLKRKQEEEHFENKRRNDQYKGKEYEPYESRSNESSFSADKGRGFTEDAFSDEAQSGKRTKGSEIDIPDWAASLILFLGILVPFIGAGFMAEVSGGAAAIVTFVILAVIYIVVAQKVY